MAAHLPPLLEVDESPLEGREPMPIRKGPHPHPPGPPLRLHYQQRTPGGRARTQAWTLGASWELGAGETFSSNPLRTDGATESSDMKTLLGYHVPDLGGCGLSAHGHGLREWPCAAWLTLSCRSEPHSQMVSWLPTGERGSCPDRAGSSGLAEGRSLLGLQGPPRPAPPPAHSHTGSPSSRCPASPGP